MQASFFRTLMMTAAAVAAGGFFNAPAQAFSPLQALFLSPGQHPAPLSAHVIPTAGNAAAIANPADSQTAGARGFVDAMAKKTVAFLADKSISEQQKKNQFRTLMFADFDMDTIGRFVLGTYWRIATPAQREEYQKLFREMIAGVWAERFENYQGQKFELRGARRAEDSDKDTVVASVIIPADNPEIPVDWRVRFKDGHYKIVDVIVNGVSLSVTQRSDFASVIQRGGGNVQVLLANLRQQVQ
jgi:phospholipid transport system substrate-binding protein